MAKSKNNRDRPSTQIGELIDRLGPINNKSRRAEGIEKVELLWDLGDTLLKIAPEANDQLLREIQERSYITRDLLRYGLIVRRGWEKRDELRSQFPQLTRYSLFREALPFLKSDRAGIDNETYDRIVEQLNHGDPKIVKSFLKELKQQKIARSHKKGQASSRMSGQATALRSTMKQLFEFANKDPNRLVDLAESVGHDKVVRLSQCCVAMADDAEIPEIPSIAPEYETISLTQSILSEVADSNHDDQNGFRKVIGAMTLMELADLLNATLSTEKLAQWRKRRRLKFSL